MKTKLILIAVLCLAGAVPSCQTPPFATPAANVAVSTYTVQAAEHTLRAAKDTFDLFFGLVHDNHAFVEAHLPEVYAFAQRMQTQAPPILQRANRAKNAFKANRTADNQTDLNTIMATVAQLIADTQMQTKQLQTARH